MLKDEILNLKKNGSTIIFSTHNMASVEEICDNIALINKSEKVLDGSVAEIKNKYKSNIFQIKYGVQKTSFLQTDEFEIIEQKENFVKIKIKNEKHNNKLISYASNFGNIISFNEIIPSINDIFIKVVSS